MVTIRTHYTGDLHCEAEHTPSGSVITTDAPKDNQGLGATFSPTDLVATALGTCILTTMAIVARKLGVDIDDARAQVVKEMAAAPSRRIGSLAVEIVMPTGIAVEHREKLESAAHKCPVHLSMHPEVKMPIRIVWG